MLTRTQTLKTWHQPVFGAAPEQWMVAAGSFGSKDSHTLLFLHVCVRWKWENVLILEGEEEEENSCNFWSEATTNGFSSSLLLAGVAPEATISRSFILFRMTKVRRREMRDARCEMTSKSALLLLLLLLLVGIVQQLLWCLHFFPQPLESAFEPSSGAFLPPYYHSCLLGRDSKERESESERGHFWTSWWEALFLNG